MDEWTLPSSQEMLQRRIGARIAQPWRERAFVFGRYDAFLARLAADERVRIVPLAELEQSSWEGPVVALRHDVDHRLAAALEFARLEHARGIRSTFYVLHTAPYYDDDVVRALRALQDRFGHEVGWHNDLVTLECVHGVDARSYLARELARLRGAGIDVRGVVAHGSYWGHALGYDNTYFFADFPGVRPGFPNRDVVDGRVVPKGTLAEFGFAYDANHLSFDRFYSDARYDRSGRRWHPDFLDLHDLRDGERVVVLVHADHWDRSVPLKFARLLGRGIVRSAQLLRDRASQRAWATTT